MDKWVEKCEQDGEPLLCPYPDCNSRIFNTRRYVNKTRPLKYQTVEKPEERELETMNGDGEDKSMFSTSMVDTIEDNKMETESGQSQSIIEKKSTKRKTGGLSTRPTKFSKDEEFLKSLNCKYGSSSSTIAMSK